MVFAGDRGARVDFEFEQSAQIQYEPAVVGATLAAQNMLNEINGFAVQSTTLEVTKCVGTSPVEMKILETVGDGRVRTTDVAVDRTIMGNLDTITLSRRGRPEGEVTAQRDWGGNLIALIFDYKDGKADGTGTFRHSGSTPGPYGIRIDRDKDGDTDLNVSFHHNDSITLPIISEDMQDTGETVTLPRPEITGLDLDTNGDGIVEQSFETNRNSSGCLTRIKQVPRTQ